MKKGPYLVLLCLTSTCVDIVLELLVPVELQMLNALGHLTDLSAGKVFVRHSGIAKLEVGNNICSSKQDISLIWWLLFVCFFHSIALSVLLDLNLFPG